MRIFSSYGPVDRDIHYYAPRKELIESAYMQLIGEDPEKGGRYITVWAPRQSGKTWIMQQALFRLRKDRRFDVVKVNLEHLKMKDDIDAILKSLSAGIIKGLGKELPDPDMTTDSVDLLQSIFEKNFLSRPLILILDEFDALAEDAISAVVSVLRNIYMIRQDQSDRTTRKKDYLLHSVALIGVRSVLGIENVKGSPFNVQRSLHIPNLTYDEVNDMFRWYQRESGQKIGEDVVERLFYETRGQPGLTCWFGELLTETYNRNTSEPISMKNFEIVGAAAVKALPNANILNIISKADNEPYKSAVLDLFRTEKKTEFSYDDSLLNYLYQNGVIDQETENETDYYARFACPFVQKRLFNYFARELFGYTGRLSEPFENLSDTVTEDSVNIGNLIRRFQGYLKKNREWLLADAPRRKDMRIFEAVWHFNLYRYLCDFLEGKKAKVWPEFPAGNGKVDIIIEYGGRIYALEVKSYTDESGYYEALDQAARYGKQLGLSRLERHVLIDEVQKEIDAEVD